MEEERERGEVLFICELESHSRSFLPFLPHHSDQRRISLKFLAWYFLNVQMQSEDIEGHDSIEDAMTALKVGEQGKVHCFETTSTLSSFPHSSTSRRSR